MTDIAGEVRKYEGSELDLFQKAVRWKTYYGNRLKPFIRGSVLEVGAGIGGTTQFLLSDSVTAWTCLEPDPELQRVIGEKIAKRALPHLCRARTGTLASLHNGEFFDTIVYIDVLEHIEDDRGEVMLAAQRLAPGGRIVVLSPAHPFLFSPFDQAVGHFRRYTKASLKSLRPDALMCRAAGYLDSVGLIASLGNRVLLKSSSPTLKQIALWDRVMVPLSRLLDPALRVGKSVFVVWEKDT